MQAAHPSNLPFTYALTKFLNKKIEQLMQKLDTEPQGHPPTEAEMQMLSPVVKNLLKVLTLETCETRGELQKKLKEIDQENTKVKQDIETGLIKGCHSLFTFLQESALSGELFYILTDLALEPFSQEIHDKEVWKSMLDEEQAKLKRVSNDLFEKIIETVVEEHVGSKKDTAAIRLSENAFDDGRQMSQEVFTGMANLCTQIVQKVELAVRNPTPENNIQEELASLFQIIKVFANRKEITDRIEKFQPKQRDAIWRTMTPIYEQVEKMAKTALELQDLQEYYIRHTHVANQAKFIKAILSSIRIQFLRQPRHFQNPFVETLKKVYVDIEPSLGKQAPNAIKLQQCIHDVSRYSDSISKEQMALDALYLLYPPRGDNEEVPQMGLVEQLLQFDRGDPPYGFQPRACLNEIAKLLPCFSADEQLQIKALIGSGARLSERWEQLRTVLQGMYERHSTNKNRDCTALNEVLTESEQWAGEMQVTYSLIAADNQRQMDKNSKAMGTEVERLKQSAMDAQLHLPYEWGQLFLGRTPGIISGGIGLALGPFTYLGALSVGLGAGLWKGKQIINQAAQWSYKSEITKVFTNACKLLHSPRIYYAAATRGLKTLSERNLNI